jgi:cyclopropane fatty-acyl-phospholipid synthase-like methyltransferase
VNNPEKPYTNPGQTTTGFFQIFESARIFDFFQSLIGANRSRKQLIEKFVRPKKDALILDIGCGTGAILDFLPKEVNYVGIDVSEQYIKEAERRYCDRRARFTSIRVGEINLDKDAGKFDVVMANGVLHHLDNQEAEKLLFLAHEHLRIGGVFVSLDPVYVPDQSRLARMVVSHDRGDWVRDVRGYAKIIDAQFSNYETEIIYDNLYIPNTDLMIRATK